MVCAIPGEVEDGERRHHIMANHGDIQPGLSTNDSNTTEHSTMISTSCSSLTACLHVGHCALVLTQDVMHCRQNRCPHGVTAKRVICSKQMIHVSSSVSERACRPARDSKYDTAELCLRISDCSSASVVVRRTIRWDTIRLYITHTHTHIHTHTHTRTRTAPSKPTDC